MPITNTVEKDIIRKSSENRGISAFHANAKNCIINV